MTLELFASYVLDAVSSGRYLWLAALAVFGLVFVARKYLSAKIPFLATKTGLGLLAFFGAFAGALVNSFAAGTEVSATVLLAALNVGIMALLAALAVKEPKAS